MRPCFEGTGRRGCKPASGARATLRFESPGAGQALRSDVMSFQDQTRGEECQAEIPTALEESTKHPWAPVYRIWCPKRVVSAYAPLGRPLSPLGRPLSPLGRPLSPLGRPLSPLGGRGGSACGWYGGVS